jgi:hypothetical protein
MGRHLGRLAAAEPLEHERPHGGEVLRVEGTHTRTRVSPLAANTRANLWPTAAATARASRSDPCRPPAPMPARHTRMHACMPVYACTVDKPHLPLCRQRQQLQTTLTACVRLPLDPSTHPHACLCMPALWTGPTCSYAGSGRDSTMADTIAKPSWSCALPGESVAGDTSAGDTSAGDTSAGDTSAGDTSAGDTSAGRPTRQQGPATATACTALPRTPDQLAEVQPKPKSGPDSSLPQPALTIAQLALGGGQASTT